MSQMINNLDIQSLSPAERIVLVEQIWDSIVAEEDALEVTQAQKEELDRRSAAHEANPVEGSTWEAVKSRLQGER